MCSLLFHNAGQPTTGDSERENISTIVITLSSFLTAAATIVLVGITGWYVYLTRQMLKVANTPVVRMFLHTREYAIFLCVENIGTGFARNIKFTGDLSFKPIPWNDNNHDKPLKELEPFKSGIPYLGAGHKRDRPISYATEFGSLPKHAFDIIVTYNDLGIAKETKTFSFEIGNWDNTDQFGSPHTDEVATAVERVAGNLEMLRRHRPGSDHMKQPPQQLRKDPKIELLERIANALEKMQSDE